MLPAPPALLIPWVLIGRALYYDFLASSQLTADAALSCKSMAPHRLPPPFLLIFSIPFPVPPRLPIPPLPSFTLIL